jgi:TolA-binding protein
MNRLFSLVIPGVALVSLGASVYMVWPPAAAHPQKGSALSSGSKDLAELDRMVQDLRSQVAQLKNAERSLPASRSGAAQAATGEPTAGATSGASNGPGSMEQRLRSLEGVVAALQSAMEGVSIEKASAERQALFAAEEGYLKADEYFEAGKYAIAGEGYLTFIQNHPDHADTREIMKKARDAFLKAGYKDKAFWVQEEMNKRFPQYAATDIWEQAHLEKEAGRYNEAVLHAAQAAELTANIEERLWRRLYWAYFVELRDGTAAGIAAYLQVQQEIAASGVTNPRLIARAQEKLLELQRKRQ